ncbi:ECF transporter S component [Bacillota bacterium LX-D]|nr:ECF transporter S component [Bacillota bacterium LX-D]
MSKIQCVTRTALFLALALTVQMAGLPQKFTGPAVNGILFLSGIFVNPLSGICIGILTPLLAFLRGILPGPLAPAIPFIMLGNALFVYFSCLLFKRPLGLQICGVMAGAITKFLVLSLAVNYLVNVPPAAAKILTLPQLFTALLGGFAALFLAQILINILTPAEN